MTIKNAFKTYAATRQNEPELEGYFVQTDVIKKIKESKEICVISGLKGIGKTATFRELTEFDKSMDAVIEISSETYSLNLPHSKLRAINYSHEFEYEITIEFLQKIINDDELKKEIDPQLIKAAKKHVDSFLEDLKELGGRVTGVSILGCGLNLSDPEKKVLTGLKGRSNELEALETLKNICDSGIRLRLVIDDPEEVFFSDDNLNLQLLGGLWLATAKLNLISENFRSYLLMKTHIHDFVFHSTPDLDKYPNSRINICWEQSSLKKLIEKRLQHFLKLAPEDDWEKKLFGEEYSQEISEKCYEFIFENLRNGPRELITWLYFALEFNQSEGKNYLTFDSLKQTFISLSNNSFNFFNSSHGEEFPDIGSIVQLIFENNEEQSFSKKELTKRIKELQQNSKDFQNIERKHFWIQSTVSKSYSDILFRVGAINLMGEKEVFPYMCDYNSDNFNKSSEFKLTPIFRNYVKNQ